MPIPDPDTLFLKVISKRFLHEVIQDEKVPLLDFLEWWMSPRVRTQLAQFRAALLEHQELRLILHTTIADGTLSMLAEDFDQNRECARKAATHLSRRGIAQLSSSPPKPAPPRLPKLPRAAATPTADSDMAPTPHSPPTLLRADNEILTLIAAAGAPPSSPSLCHSATPPLCHSPSPRPETRHLAPPLDNRQAPPQAQSPPLQTGCAALTCGP